MKTALLSPQDPRWAEALHGARCEFYHSPEYCDLEARRLEGEARAVLVSDDRGSALLPMIFRPVGDAEGLVDAVSPYGYPGLALAGCALHDPGFVRRAVDSMAETLRGAGVVTAFIRLNPLLDDPNLYSEVGTLVEHGEVTWIDLSKDREEIHRGMRSRFRSYVNAAIRGGVSARFDGDWIHLEEFVDLYHRTMERVGAASWYFLGVEYFKELKGILGERLKLCVVERDGEILAAGLFAISNGIVQYLFSGVDVEAGEPHATKVMMVFVRDWGKDQEAGAFHLGGGVGSGVDELSRFKRGFSKLTKPFFTWRMVFNEAECRNLISKWESDSGVEADDVEGFFPPYRKPLS